jgi:hypothetical protein
MATLEKRIAAEYQKASGIGAIVHAVNCGRLLCQAKARCKRGEWSPWLASHWLASVRVANDYMRLSGAVASGSISGWETLSIDEALRSIRSRQRKPQQPVSTATATDTTTPSKTPAENLKGQIHSLSVASNSVAVAVDQFLNGSDDGRPVKVEWQDARPTIEDALRVSFGMGTSLTSREYQPGAVTFVSENVMSGDSGLCEAASWKGKGLRVTVTVEIVD